MASKYLQKYPVPAGFQEVLADFTREILRDQPTNIIEYAAKYFQMLEKGEKFEFDSKFNVKKDEKKHELAYNPKNAEEITKKASNIAQQINGAEGEAQARATENAIGTEKTVNAQEVEDFMESQTNSVVKQDLQAQIQKVFDMFDADNSGYIDFKELKNIFKSIMEQGQVALPSEEAFLEVFAVFDQDGNGKITRQEFKNVFENMGMN